MILLLFLAVQKYSFIRANYNAMQNGRFFVPLGKLSLSVYLGQLVPMAYDLTMTYQQVSANWGLMVSFLCN